jgi:hypothetical protein
MISALGDAIPIVKRVDGSQGMTELALSESEYMSRQAKALKYTDMRFVLAIMLWDMDPG